MIPYEQDTCTHRFIEPQLGEPLDDNFIRRYAAKHIKWLYLGLFTLVGNEEDLETHNGVWRYIYRSKRSGVLYGAAFWGCRSDICLATNLTYDGKMGRRWGEAEEIRALRFLWEYRNWGLEDEKTD